jgi:hypothetical protein
MGKGVSPAVDMNIEVIRASGGILAVSAAL